MVIGIIILHLPPSQPLNELSTLFDFIKAFFSHGVFRSTVPMLTVISGFLLFKSSLYLQPFQLLLNKSKSIFIPLVIWNIPFVIAIYLSQKFNFLSHDFSVELYPFNLLNWTNALTGLFSTPANYPLNFLRDLFAVSLLAPILGLLLKRIPYLGLIIVLIVYYFNFDGSLILRNTMLVSFYIGGLAATQGWSLTYLDKYAKLLLLLFILYCLAIVLFNIQNIEVFRLLSPFLVWPLMSLIINTKLNVFLYKNSANSFFTFLVHGPIILLLWIAFKKIPVDIPYYIYWFLAPVITVFLSIFFAKLFHKIMPRISSITLGGR
ncbi:hypothetical protein E2R68_03530 [Psychromonas sp. RZ22]|uniref:acyltransferase family protein n=1 Tax=Psychromonas algarum TaxID=2555643 RepID=UPI001067B635|nr:acyltransferase family protein [Psychromonas sp. RZ22]TEW56177.1 hypothetical protein E2R68_03530 [Psychromonas sp. RZ22]